VFSEKVAAKTLLQIPTCPISMQMKLLLFQEIRSHPNMQFSSISGQKGCNQPTSKLAISRA